MNITDNIALHFPNIATFFVSILVSQIITTIYYAYNVFGRLQMELSQDVQFSPEEREMLAYDVPQSGAAASLASTIILTFVLTNILVENQIQSLESMLIVCFILWLVAAAFSFNRYISYNMSEKLFLIDTLNDAIQLLSISFVVIFFEDSLLTQK
ncbi:hypothetical protein Glove_299g34 [Diversispora epigaea]|uniref:Uncharacterized protein n=1 Tax=Diversispora epigaea TaxID=1348612 RepID=A0A397I308_9GLOM|nr:hypothetical protein Glove_299g34 [Diversispora epigaea]